MPADDVMLEDEEFQAQFELACLKQGLEQLNFQTVYLDEERIRYSDDHVQSMFIGFRMGLEASAESG